MRDHIIPTAEVFVKHYDPATSEKKWLHIWTMIMKDNNENCHGKEPFCLLLPPPNVTGTLHMGHALTVTIQDCIVRFKKMLGYHVIWIPGTDHAGIATQSVVDRSIRKKENRPLHSLEKEEAYKRLWQWTEEHKHKIIQQLELLGCLLDWKYFLFSMDANASQAVNSAFHVAVTKNFIYQGEYLVNWDFGTGTALSDDEVLYEEQETSLITLRYQVNEEHIPIATTRPETIWGDTAIAVHPEDKRYAHLIGQNAIVPLVGRSIPIIGDKRVCIDFGTGAVKITPGHDPLDYAIGVDHCLPMLSILDEQGFLKNSELLDGLPVEEARATVIKKLENKGFLLDKQRHMHRICISYRSGSPIETILSKQWFFRLSSFKEELAQALKQKEIRLFPEGNWDTTYLYWVKNLKDWCISRQLLWGHPIPVWHKIDSEEWICSASPIPKEVAEAPDLWKQDPDVLDTWFSSALWPLTTLGWPNKSADFDRFYPHALCETGFDIIFFWVTRMLVMGKLLTGKWPFRDIYLHGMIFAKSYWIKTSAGQQYILGSERDNYELCPDAIPENVQSKWEKMSKSKGNIIDPLDLAKEYGTDAMRMALLSLLRGSSTQLDLDPRRFHIYKHFIDKLWNASRFVVQSIQATGDTLSLFVEIERKHHTLEDRWILSRWSQLVTNVHTAFASYHLEKVLEEICTFFWEDFCDYYLELVKPRLYHNLNRIDQNCAKSIVFHLLLGNLRLQHPFIPFVTEHIFEKIRNVFPLTGSVNGDSVLFKENVHSLKKESCILCQYPLYDASLHDFAAEKAFSIAKELIKTIRKLRAEAKLHPTKKVTIFIEHWDPTIPYADSIIDIIRALIPIESIQYMLPATAMSTTMELTHQYCVHLVIEAISPEEKTRLEKELVIVERELSRLSLLIQNIDFVSKAPQHVQKKQKDALKLLQEQKETLQNRLTN